MNSMLRLLLCCCLGCCATINLWAQARLLTSFAGRDGLAQSQVEVVLADRHGYIWAGTQGGGLSRYDGQSFTTYNERNGLGGRSVQALWEAGNGDIWVGMEYGIKICDGRAFRSALQTNQPIIAIDGSTDQNVWALSTSKVYHWQGEQWDTIALPRSYTEAYSLIVEQDRILLGTDRGLWQRRNKRWTPLAANYVEAPQVWHLYQYHNGPTRALTPYGEAFVVGKDSLTASTCPVRVPTCYLVDRANTIWVGSQSEGLYALPRGARRWQRYAQQQGLISVHVKSITEDAWGNVWVGTSGGGLAVLRQAPFQAYDTDRGLAGTAVYDLLYQDSLGLLFTVNGAGVYQMTENGPQSVLSERAIQREKVKVLAIDEKGRYMLGTQNNGLWWQADSIWQQITSCGRNIVGVLPAGLQQWWIATEYEGVHLLTLEHDSLGWQSSCRTFGTNDELPIGRLSGLTVNSNGQLLIRYRNNGLACWAPNQLFWHAKPPGGGRSNDVRAVRQDSSGHYWLATASGLLQFEPPNNYVRYGIADGLSSNNIYSLVFDSRQHLWVGAENGVDELLFDEQGTLQSAIHYGTAEGFTGIENCTDAALRAPEGQLWFGTMNGLMQYWPGQNTSTTQGPPPQLGLTNVEVDFQDVRDSIAPQLLDGWGDVQGELILSHQQNDLGFGLNALSQSVGQRIQYQWQLEGWDEQWLPPSTSSDVRYANLPPGDYTFRARARHEEQHFSEPLVLKVSIVPAFWQTSWFRWAAAITLFILVLLLGWWWLRRWQARQRIEAERLRLANHLLELEHKALQLQMNPHFLANVLQGLQQEIRSGQHQRAEQYLQKFGQLMRSMLYHSRSKQVVLSDELTMLQHYLELEQYRLGKSFDYQFHYTEDLEVDIIAIPPMLLQPFLENAVKHGMQSKNKGGLIDIFVNDKKETLEVIIRDNGPGLEATTTQNATNHRSTALKVIQERLALLGHSFTKATPYQIQEILSNGQVEGVEVKLRIPILDPS